MENKNITRRDFLKYALLGTAGLCLTSSKLMPLDYTPNLPLIIDEVISSVMRIPLNRRISFRPNDRILFQGDSITDAGRDRKALSPNTPATYGKGYLKYLAELLHNKYADKNLHIYNRGISGNRVEQLEDRWVADCLELHPDVLSVLVGVNDFLSMALGGSRTYAMYKETYISILSRALNANPSLRIVIMEPFAIEGVKSVTKAWYPDFDQFRALSEEVADRFNAAYIPLQSLFIEAIKYAPANYWTHDGIHANPHASQLIAAAWMSAIRP